MLFGGIASLIFVVVLSNTDRTDRLRLIALSLLAGFAWQPVLSAARTYASSQSQRTEARQIEADLRQLQQRLDALSKRTAEGNEGELDAIVGDLRQVHGQLFTIDSVSLRTPLQQQLVQLTDKLASANPARHAPQLPFDIANNEMLRYSMDTWPLSRFDDIRIDESGSQEQQQPDGEGATAASDE